MRKIVQKTSFLGGEAGPLLNGRSDLAQFQLGARSLENFIVLKGGGITRRPGTRYVKNTLNDQPARLIPFIFSYDQSNSVYVVEITKASSSTLEFRVINVTDNSVITPTGHQLSILSGDQAYINLDEIQYSQSADFLFLTHRSFEPQILLRTSVSAFTRTPYISYVTSTRALAQSLPFFDENTSATTLQVNTHTAGTGRTITFSAATLTGTSTDVGKWFNQLDTATLGSCQVTAAISTTQATVTVVDAWNADASATTTWWEGAWSPASGWPRTICFYNQRLVFGGNTVKPDTFWMSQVSNYLKMSATNAAFAINNPITETLASDNLNQIRWMLSSKNHTIGTSTAEWVGSITNDGTNLIVQYDKQTTHGSAPVQPRQSAYTIPFVQRSGQTIREMYFDFYSNTYTATDLNLFASHIGTPYGRFVGSSSVSIVQTAYQESPFSVLWVLDSVGRLYGLTREKQQQIAAWHSHVIAGYETEQNLNSLDGPNYPAIVKSICVVPDSTGKKDRLWMVVDRAINGVSKYHVEYVDDLKTNNYVTSGTTGDLKAFLDCATYQTGAASTSWSGYTRFESDSAYFIASDANGNIVFNGTLAVDGSGNITLPIAATSVMGGLHANAYVRLLPLEGSGDGPPINLRSMKRVDMATIRLHETYGLMVGKDQILGKGGYSDNTTFEAIPFDTTQFSILPTFTGVKEVPIPTSSETDGAFAFAMKQPWPCTILAVSSRIVTNEA